MLFLVVVFTSNTTLAQEEFYHPELEWRTIESEHFLVHFHTGTERTARVIAKIAEEIYEPITTLYNYQPDGKISFIIKDYDDYSNGAAYFLDNKIEIWASSMDFDLRGTHNWLRNVVTHEFTHIVQIQTSLKFGRRVPAFYLQWLQYESERRTDVLYGYPNGIVSYPISGFIVPSWFAEGVAQYNRKELEYDSWDSHRDMILRMYALDDNMLSWNEMAVFGKTSLGNESAYNAGFAFVRFIAEEYGDEKLMEISRNLSSLVALTIDGAIEKAIGKSGSQLYEEWKASLKRDYADRTAQIKNNLVAGGIIADVGFGNFYPTFSPEGEKIAYVSNKKADYFSQSSLYLYDLITKTEKKLKGGVRSSLSWSPDGKKIYYAKTSRKNDHWSNLYDIYEYNIEREEEKRLTYGLRANSPSISPDGRMIAFVSGSDGTLNLYTMNVDGTNMRKLTNYTNSEQVYNPKWSPDGKSIVFDYSMKDGRDVAMIASDEGEVIFLLSSPEDERHAVFTRDGSNIIYSSDKTGIFNLYQLDLSTKEVTQLTNVVGGAFMPSMNAQGMLAFASYTSSGYKISLFEQPRPLHNPPVYIPIVERTIPLKLASASKDVGNQSFNWQVLRKYDDTELPSFTETPYKATATSLTFVPFLRLDNYNPQNKGIDLLKLGLYGYSYDVLDRYGFFGGAAFNKRGERDLFFIFDYRGKIPGLFHLGLEPALSFEVYNITRKTNSIVPLPLDTIPVEVSYNLLEFDLALKQKILSEVLELELRYAHSRYTASIGSFFLPEINDLVKAFSELYFIGNDLSLILRYDGIALSRTQEINPVGRKIRLRYDYEFNKFNPTSEYEVANGLLVPKYQRPVFHRVELSWREHQRLPGWKHTLSLQLRGGSILGPPVDNFFDFYIGGLAGMKGYPFYSLGGNEFVYANVTYRFPLFENIDLRILQLYFDKLYAAVYSDVGTIWTDGVLRDQKFKRDAGVELRLEAFSYYVFPTRIFFNATYGFDEFDRYIPSDGTTVRYGKEWNFHFGVLFGFDLD
ncbi:MAG: PD40 domain-containing protein [Ignavibacteriae bacterium]|nr:PD40 domain-containing protein [Ignavibacteriota bacterium]